VNVAAAPLERFPLRDESAFALVIPWAVGRGVDTVAEGTVGVCEVPSHSKVHMQANGELGFGTFVPH